MAIALQEVFDRWDSPEGRPYKGKLIDWDAYEADPDNIGCMCAQGQVLVLAGGWTPQSIRDIEDQAKADAEVAKLLNISRAHAVLLRNINDRADGAPSVVLRDPGKVLGDQWSKLLDFWWMFHNFDGKRWREVAAAWDAAGDAAWAAAGDAAGGAAGAAAWAAAGAAAGAAAWDAAGGAAWDAAGGAAGEIQGFELLRQRGRKPFLLPMFGINSLDDIPLRPADYGLGFVPGEAA
ncbi:hypothetical protein [Pelagerythrobacter marinus]|uniref:hypothetical protein n=1 Tax=Pelagerythrobacter marinus TaxID=538382 RepID=UPI002AC9A3EB|nr:hypothetical protein [Pelagerythrobacter marinus]WPZ05517.1 hypothetical protein T8T98_08730 [Pelagerythrobacter marinus]